MYSHTYADPNVEGVLTEKEFLALYCQHRPAPIPERELEYAKIVNILRFISYFQVCYHPILELYMVYSWCNEDIVMSEAYHIAQLKSPPLQHPIRLHFNCHNS